MSRFFIDRPIFAWVLSIVIVISGLACVSVAADRAVSADRAADDPGDRDLSRRECEDRVGRGRSADRGAGQRRRGHDLHVVDLHQQRAVHADRQLRGRHRHQHGPDAGADSRATGHPATAAKACRSRAST